MKVAVVGCGGIGRRHASAYQLIPGVEILYMIDSVKELADAAAADFGAKALYDISEMTEKPDVISVATPSKTHAELILKLIDMGIPVFAEKPLTIGVAEAHAVVEAAEKAGLPVGIGFKMRHESVFQKAKELIGRIGKLYAVSVVKNQPYMARPNAWVPHVGCMYELSVHEYDLVNWIADIHPVSVLAKTISDFEGWTEENRAFLDVDYNTGIKGQFFSGYSPYSKFSFNDLSITYVGEGGYMRIERNSRIFLHTDTDEVFTVVPKDDVILFAEELTEFLDAVREGKKPVPDVHEGANMTFMVEAAKESSRRGERVPVEEV